MKIAHIVTNDSGGAGKAAERIVWALNTYEDDIEAKTFVAESRFDSAVLLNNSGIQKLSYIIKRKINGLVVKISRPKHMFSIDFFGENILKNKDIRNADLINLHWVEAGVVPVTMLKKLSTCQKPIVWTFHDMCPFTGGCHYDGECGKYKTSCSDCPSLRFDYFASLNFKLKVKYVQRMNVVGVGCSKWISECAQDSTIFQNIGIRNIGNPINSEIFHSKDKFEARKYCGIASVKKVVLFGAISSDKDERKGISFLLEATRLLDPNDYTLAVFGNGDSIKEKFPDFEVIEFGVITDVKKLSLVYSCADVFIAPSKQENLSNAVMESLFCGTPVTAFDVGGMRDMISHKENGYLASPFDVNDLFEGIKFCCENYNVLHKRTNIVEEKYSGKNVADQYYSLYKEMLGRR